MTSRRLVLVARFIIGLLFFIAGGLKALQFPQFIHHLTEYRLFPPANLIFPARLLIGLEIVTGIACFFPPPVARAALTLVIGLVLCFQAIVAFSLWRGLAIACGCFGFDQDSSENLTFTFLRNLLLLALAMWTWAKLSQTQKATPGLPEKITGRHASDHARHALLSWSFRPFPISSQCLATELFGTKSSLEFFEGDRECTERKDHLTRVHPLSR